MPLEIPELREIFVKMQPVARGIAEIAASTENDKTKAKPSDVQKRSYLEEFVDNAQIERDISEDPEIGQ
jgi:hypothetical protein